MIRFRHCDPAGIVFYPRYLEMLNDTVEDWFDEMGFPFQEMKGRYGAGVPTVNLNIRFTQPCRQGERLLLALSCLKQGDSSIEIAIEGARRGQTVLEARIVLCFTTVGETIGKLSIPLEIRRQVAKYIRTEASVGA
ncbi:acyl-CoA thioesterase [Marinobacterium aestuariivivens]|uniref:Acyl-CoA thioesterase n=1 Tax=Marinobacterium aestuariivivens TaxID=1698799 RepID=A0ABW1ZWQ5_9GAMM